MTRAEILALPPGRQLDGLIAYHVFGWRWWRNNNHNLAGLFPPDTPDFVRWNFNPLVFTELPDEFPDNRYADWWRCGSRQRDAQGEVIRDLPNYSTEFRDLEEVLESFGTDCGVILTRRQRGDYVVTIWDYASSNQVEFVEAKTAPHAVCLARLLLKVTA